jgi:predicted ATPase/DNA-binding SARP family transcriptional activator/Tfp pilus assembly protein PilF
MSGDGNALLKAQFQQDAPQKIALAQARSEVYKMCYNINKVGFVRVTPIAATLGAGMTLRVQLFGEFRAWRGKEDLTPTLTHLGKPKTLFKIFITHPGRIFSQDELIELLWPEAPADRSAANLRKRISELRQVLEPKLARGSDSRYILTRPGGYCFNPHAPCTTDVGEFMQAWEAGQKLERAGQIAAAIQHYQTAAALVQGEYLAEDRYEEWAIALREKWSELLLALWARLADCHAHFREYESALKWTQRIVEAAPWREGAYRQKMLYHYLAGEQSEAVQTYHTCVQALQTHLGVEPAPQTRTLYEQILRRQVPELLRIPHNLPQPLTSFIGRAQELRRVKQLLATTRLLTLTGAGGCGKTRLALHVATELLPEYPDGVWLVELAALSDPAHLPQQVATILGVREQPGRSLLETIAEHLRQQEMLIVLDNCEHLLHACAQLAQAVLQAAPKVHIVATSREALGVQGETIMQVPPLSVPSAGPLPPLKVLKDCESVSLFVERAAAVRLGFTLTKENAPAVVQICRRVEGIPLALELAAARVKVLSVDQIAARLDDSLRLLCAGRRTAPPRHQTLRATLDWSFRLLSDKEQTLVRRLSVFSGGFDLEAAEAVCAGRGITADSVFDLLTHLVDKSLVIAEEHEGQMRYRLLETVRQYAREKLAEAHEERSIRARHLDFYVTLMAQAWDAIGGEDEAVWLERLEREHDNLRAAMQWALETERVEAALRLAKTLWVFWDVRGYRSEGRAWLKRVLAKAQGLRTELYARVLTGAGRLACAQGDYPEARSLFQQTLEIFQELSDKRGIASSWVNLGLVASMQGNHSEARAFYEQALALHRAIGNLYGVATALGNLGGVAWEQGEYATARAFYEEELAIRRHLREPEGIASSLSALGGLAQLEGDYDRAVALFEEGLALQRKLGNKAGIAYALSNLGSVAYDRGDYALARSRYEESLQIRRELDDKQGVAYSLSSLGSVALRQGDRDRARALFEESLSLFRQMGVRGGLAGALSGLASVAYYQREYERAAALYRESLRLRQEGGEKPNILSCFEGLAAVLRAQGQLRRAVILCAAAQTLHEALGLPRAPGESADYERELTAARSELDEETFTAAWAKGQAMTLEQALEYALRD